jgi:outer membrane protein, adhesin transport system
VCGYSTSKSPMPILSRVIGPLVIGNNKMPRVQSGFRIAFAAGGALFLAAGCAGKPQLDTTTTASVPVEQRAEQTAERTITRSDGPLTFEGAVQQAVAWHPAVTESISRLQQQGANVAEARSGYMPRINWGLDSAYDSEGDRGYRPLLSVSGSQMIYDFGKVRSKVQIAEIGVVGWRAQVLSAVDELARDTAHAFIEVRRAEALRKVARDQIADTTEILELVQARTDSGASTRSDQLQAQSRVQAAEATLEEIEAQLSRWQGVLAAATGRSAAVVPQGEFPAWLNSACARGQPEWSAMPAILQAEAEQEAARLQVDLSRSESFPTVSLDGRAGSDVFRIGSVEPEYRVGLNVSGSLYNGGENAARRDAAIFAQAASEAVTARVRLDVQRNLAEATSQISSLRQLQASLSAREGVMRETRQLYQTQYIELGTRSLLDVVNAAQELHGARLDRANIEHDLHRLNTDCTFNAGRMRNAFSLEGALVQGMRL